MALFPVSWTVRGCQELPALPKRPRSALPRGPERTEAQSCLKRRGIPQPSIPPHSSSLITLDLAQFFFLSLFWLHLYALKKTPAPSAFPTSPPGGKEAVWLLLQGSRRRKTHSAGAGSARRGWGPEQPREGGRQRRRLFTDAFTPPPAAPRAGGSTSAARTRSPPGPPAAPSLRPKPAPLPRSRAVSPPSQAYSPRGPARRQAEA